MKKDSSKIIAINVVKRLLNIVLSGIKIQVENNVLNAKKGINPLPIAIVSNWLEMMWSKIAVHMIQREIVLSVKKDIKWLRMQEKLAVILSRI